MAFEATGAARPCWRGMARHARVRGIALGARPAPLPRHHDLADDHQASSDDADDAEWNGVFSAYAVIRTEGRNPHADQKRRYSGKVDGRCQRSVIGR